MPLDAILNKNCFRRADSGSSRNAAPERTLKYVRSEYRTMPLDAL